VYDAGILDTDKDEEKNGGIEGRRNPLLDVGNKAIKPF